MSDYVLRLGDCLEIMPTIPVGSVDAIIADWPFGQTDCDWDSVIPLAPLWAECTRVIKPRGAIVLFGSQPFTTDLINSNRDWFKYCWVWDKRMATGAGNVSRMPMKAHEDILVFSNGACTYHPQMETRTPSELKRLTRKGYTTKIGQSFSNGRLRSANIKSREDSTMKYPRSLIRIAGVVNNSPEKRTGLHPTQKPLALLEYLILTYTTPGDLVLDNTFGSCTTGHAAIKLGRRFIGIEKDPGYFEIGSKRMEDAARQLRGGVEDLPIFEGLKRNDA